MQRSKSVGDVSCKRPAGITAALFFVVRTHKDYFPHLTDIADTHLPIIVALRTHDVENAARLIQEHIMLIWKLFGVDHKKSG